MILKIKMHYFYPTETKLSPFASRLFTQLSFLTQALPTLPDSRAGFSPN